MLRWQIVNDHRTQTLAVAAESGHLYCVRWIDRSLYLFHAYGRGPYRYLECSRSALRIRDHGDAHLRMMLSDGTALNPEDDEGPI